MSDTGDSESGFLIEIADALLGTDLGLKTIGENEDRTFSIVVMGDLDGVAVAFTGQNSFRVKDAFVQFCADRKRRE